MNRFWLFQTMHYEATGGLADLQYTFKTLEAAKSFVESEDGHDLDSSDIVDSDTWTLVCMASHRYGSNDKIEWIVPDEIHTYNAGEPEHTLDGDGKILCISTPSGMNGTLYDLFKSSTGQAGKAIENDQYVCKECGQESKDLEDPHVCSLCGQAHPNHPDL